MIYPALLSDLKGVRLGVRTSGLWVAFGMSVQFILHILIFSDKMLTHESHIVPEIRSFALRVLI